MAIISRGLNVGRQLTGGSGRNNITEQRLDHAQSGRAPTLQRAVVVDVFFDPASLTDEQLSWLEDNTINPELVEGLPQNSILGRVITNSQDLGSQELHIFYPLFPSHLQLPVKPGEQVLILYEDYSQQGNSMGYWLTRPMEPRQVEDLNYTHHDRIFDPSNHPRNMDNTARNALTSSAPTFPNGAETPESFSLYQRDAVNPYNNIVSAASSSILFVPEVSPRFKKRPGDLLFQGSNNTLIRLGTDRTGPVVPLSGSTGVDARTKAGTIDIVAGLGAPRKLPENQNQDPSEDAGNPTSPRVIQNSRRNKEVDKTPYKNRKQDNPREGDPDFKRDLSRVYISMKTKGDKNFGVKLGSQDGIYQNSETKLSESVQDLPDQNQEDGQPFVVLKSEQLRLIATKKDERSGPEENGEIRLIKEGTEEEKDLSLFLMTKTGNIVMVGKNVQVQTHEDGQVFIACKNSEPSESDPIVLFSKFKECLEDIHQKMDNLKNTISQQIENLGTQGLAVPNAAGPFSPIPALVTLRALTSVAANNIRTTNVNFTNKIDPCKSTKVFINKG